MATKIPKYEPKVKVLREFYFKPDDSKPAEKPRKQRVGTELNMTESEFSRYYAINRVCLLSEFDARVKQYAKAEQPAERKKG